VSREVGRNHGRLNYRAGSAERAAQTRGRRPKPAKLTIHSELWAEVVARLELNWSPEQISRFLKEEHPGEPSMQVSHETIYLSLYVQGRGLLRKELTKHLRRRHQIRHPKARVSTNHGKIRDMINISERPAEAADRAVPGHWEGDLLLGTPTTAIGTLVERSTRFVMLFKLPSGINAESARLGLTQKILTLPENLRRSLAWDQGREMKQHVRFTVDTGVQVYFCDPNSPWQRGTNENTNGLLRQYFPSGKTVAHYSQEHLDMVAAQLNDRPRETLGWKSPAMRLAQFLEALSAAGVAPTA
jgi:IS30 family transposase